ncbi:MAG: DUF4860 domain-containing protein [Firmicutes bacterium]|nr:DUF4860 domain-containing protein [Bacillota bacterium]
MRHHNRSLLGMYTIGIAALFLVGFLLLVVFGAGSYRGTVDAREQHSQQRALLSYIATSVQQTELGHVHVESLSAPAGNSGTAATDAAGTTGNTDNTEADLDNDGVNAEDTHAGSGTAAGQMLVLDDGDTGFVTRIYLADGQLIEEYRNASTKPDPTQGRVIGTTSTFAIDAVADDLLRVTTDEGQVLVYIGGPADAGAAQEGGE